LSDDINVAWEVVFKKVGGGFLVFDWVFFDWMFGKDFIVVDYKK